jgi:hypothetical protein
MRQVRQAETNLEGLIGPGKVFEFFSKYNGNLLEGFKKEICIVRFSNIKKGLSGLSVE